MFTAGLRNITNFQKWVRIPLGRNSFEHGRAYPIRNILLHSSDRRQSGDVDTLTGEDVFSSHSYVTRSGKIYHFVADGDMAYHAVKVFKAEYFSPALQSAWSRSTL